MEMKKKLSSYTVLIGFLSVIGVLALATLVQAQNIETWTGSPSFSLKLTSEKEDTDGNRKLVTSRETFEGTMNFYWDPTKKTPTPGPDGCESELLGSDGSQICFTAIVGPSSENKKSGKGSIGFVATGYIVFIIQGQVATGITYLNGKGSYRDDGSGNMISISLSGTIGGGYLSTNNALVIFTGTIPTTHLTHKKSPPFLAGFPLF
jgi:hypothetical protein